MTRPSRVTVLLLAIGGIIAFASPYVLPRDEYPPLVRGLIVVAVYAIAVVAVYLVDRSLHRSP